MTTLPSRAVAPAVMLGLMLSGAVGCGPGEGAGRPDFGTATAAIAGGYVDEDDTAVVGIYLADMGSLCSGSLIAPNVVLTARHCVSGLDAAGGVVDCLVTEFGPLYSADDFGVTTATELDPGSLERGVAEVVGLPVSSSEVCGYDMALLILDDNVPASTATPYVPRVTGELSAGQEYFAVGYGETEAASEGWGIRRRRDELFIDCVGSACAGEHPVRSTEWLGEAGICPGDSGGPAVDAATGEVIGVTSRGPAGCGGAIYGSSLAWVQWLKDTVVCASGMGLYEAPAWTEGAQTNPEHCLPMGDPCSANASCPSDRCLAEGFCTRLCLPELGCPAGYVCSEREEELICTPESPPPPPPPFKRAPKDSACHCSSGAATAAPGAWRLGLILLLALSLVRRRQPARAAPGPPGPSCRSDR